MDAATASLKGFLVFVDDPSTRLERPCFEGDGRGFFEKTEIPNSFKTIIGNEWGRYFAT